MREWTTIKEYEELCQKMSEFKEDIPTKTPSVFESKRPQSYASLSEILIISS